MNASPNGTSPAAPAGVTMGPPSENRGYEDAMPVRLDRLHLFQIGKSPMPVKENTIPLNHVAARPPVSNANRADKPTNGPRRRILVVGAVIGVLGLFFGIRYWMYASTHEDTDDAYVTGYTHQISSRITGTIEEALVDDNWHVIAGQPLLKLDPRDYQVALEKDRASYLQAQAQLVQASAQIPLAEAQLAQAQAQADASKANSDYLQRTFKRNSDLFYQGRGSHFETGPRHGAVAGRNQRRHVQGEPGSGECCRGKPEGRSRSRRSCARPNRSRPGTS